MSRNHRSSPRNALQNKRSGAAARGRHEVRIIGGSWRGRKLRFPTGTTIRPSPDRVRETLFNWLAPGIRGARCLDLFAGSGALGFEALSRGAAGAVLVDSDPVVVGYLQRLAGELGAEGVELCQADALAWLGQARGPFDIVFLDPPFGAGLLPGLLACLDRPGRLADGARVYIESPAAEGEPALPAGWNLHRTGRAGDVGYYLAIKTTPDTGAQGEQQE